MKLILAAVCALAVSAQTIEIPGLAEPARLDGVWKYRSADDPRFAAPDYDDSSWAGVTVPGEGPAIVPGATWYRIRVRIREPLPAKPLALLMGFAGSAYDVFANGMRVGTFGDPRASGGWGQQVTDFAKFPLANPGQEMLIAIRVWHPGISSGVFLPSLDEGAWLGTSGAITTILDERRLARRWMSIRSVMTMTATVVIGIFFLLVPLWRRDAPEYLWCGLVLILGCSLRLPQAFPWMFESYTVIATLVPPVATAIVYLLAWERLFRTVFGAEPSLAARVMLGLTQAGNVMLVAVPFMTWESAGSLLAPYVILLILTLAVSYADLAWHGARVPEAGIMHTGVAIYIGSNALFFGLFVVRWLGYTPVAETGVIQRSTIESRSIGLLLLAFAMAIALNRRSARLLGEQQRLQQEITAAAEMQALLVPSDSVRVPGFETEAAYVPASEVGGDFHYALRDGDSLIILVGDVSGKGLRAAMLVAAVTGVLRTTPERRPAAILMALNRALTGQTRGGFVTACCVRFDPGGTATIANAGHVAPYCDGREVEASGLPLAVAEDPSWSEVSARGERFVLLSDGVIEAANSRGELFGFERTHEICSKSAREIADTARAWGQNDDITVVTVRRSS